MSSSFKKLKGKNSPKVWRKKDPHLLFPNAGKSYMNGNKWPGINIFLNSLNLLVSHNAWLKNPGDSSVNETRNSCLPLWIRICSGFLCLEAHWLEVGAFQVALMIKNLLANAGDIRDLGSIPGSGRYLGEGNVNPLQYSCLENLMDRGAWWAAVHGVAESQTQMNWLSTPCGDEEGLIC